MEIVLVGREPELTAAWRQVCGDLPGVTVTDGDILSLDCDAVVSPANSFGFLGGGVDLAYARHFGPHLEPRVRAAIAGRWGGELPVGCAETFARGRLLRLERGRGEDRRPGGDAHFRMLHKPLQVVRSPVYAGQLLGVGRTLMRGQPDRLLEPGAPQESRQVCGRPRNAELIPELLPASSGVQVAMRHDHGGDYRAQSARSGVTDQTICQPPASVRSRQTIPPS